MRPRRRWGFMWGFVGCLLITLLLTLGCGRDDDAFTLDACRLNEANCRLQ